MKDKNFYGKFSSGSSFDNMDKDFYGIRNISYISRLINKNLTKMRISKIFLKNKIIMNIGNGRESLALLNYNPKKIFHYDVSNVNISKFKKFIIKNNLGGKIISCQKDISKSKLPKKKFDFIYLHGIIQHVDNVNKALKNLISSMKLNGLMWFYFYRAGSFNIFLGSLQRHLLKKINIHIFKKFLKKNIKSQNFIDGIMDDCYVPNRKLFFPIAYKKYLEKNGCEIYGNTFLKRYYPNFDFINYHQSVVFFVRKKFNLKSNIKNFDKKHDVNVLNRKYYKNEELIYILKNLEKIRKLNINKIFTIVIEIEKVKQKIVKVFFEHKKLNKKKKSFFLKKIRTIISNELQDL